MTCCLWRKLVSENVTSWVVCYSTFVVYGYLLTGGTCVEAREGEGEQVVAGGNGVKFGI